MPHGDRRKAYCCVGAHIPDNVVITTTQTSCATTVSLNPITDYSSKAREAATKYGVTYTTNVGLGNPTVISMATVGVTASGSSSVSTGGAEYGGCGFGNCGRSFDWDLKVFHWHGGGVVIYLDSTSMVSEVIYAI